MVSFRYRAGWNLWLVLGSVLLASLGWAAKVQVKSGAGGWQLLVEGNPYVIKGVCYAPTRAGESPDDGTWRDWMIVDDDHDGRVDVAYQSWIDGNRNNRRDADEGDAGDFTLLQRMGCNTIRLYHHPSSNAEVQALYVGKPSALNLNHAPNKVLLRDLFKKYGIRVAMGDLLGAYTVGSGADWEQGTDYRDPEQRRRMLASVEEMVREFKDEPFLLLWILGNENNYAQFTHTNAGRYPEAYARFVEEAARRIHMLDANHPVAVCLGETRGLSAFARRTPSIDIIGLNTYREPGFGKLWKEVAASVHKPVLLTEYGVAHPRFQGEIFDESDQSRIHRLAWCDIERHTMSRSAPGNAIGGFAYEWLDSWWQDGHPGQHDRGPGGWDHEWSGLIGQGNGSESPLLRQPREVYSVYQKLWNGKEVCPP